MCGWPNEYFELTSPAYECKRCRFGSETMFEFRRTGFSEEFMDMRKKDLQRIKRKIDQIEVESLCKDVLDVKPD